MHYIYRQLVAALLCGVFSLAALQAQDRVPVPGAVPYLEVQSPIRSTALFGPEAPGGLQEAGGAIGLEISTGIQGILSFFEVGVMWPEVRGNMFLGLRAKSMSSITWATFIDEDGEYVSFHPVVVGGAFSIGGASPLVHGFLKAHGGMDILLGYSFMPYDSYFYDTGNLIGDNLTFGFLGFFGFEIFTAERLSIFIDAGGGFKSMVVDDRDNLYAIASAWLGSGFGLRIGITFYR